MEVDAVESQAASADAEPEQKADELSDAPPPEKTAEPSEEAAEGDDKPQTEAMEVENEAKESEPAANTKETVTPPDKPANALPAMPKQGSNFSLGVPGLSFSSNNVKTASDGTKMVQIHQSQITPEQLAALQNNPNIKVVFRHVPSGKSYSKPPRHLLPPGYKSAARKRKARLADGIVPSDPRANDVYSFDEGEDFEGPAKMLKSDNRARYNYGSITKKKGRPRSIPDPAAYAASYINVAKQPSTPAKVILTDLLARINNPKAVKEVKLHTSQINAEVLANMDLNPRYKLVLTSKQELPPLVIEDATKEDEVVKEDVKEEKEEEEETGKAADVEEAKATEEKQEKAEEDDKESEEEKKRLAEEMEKERRQKEEAREQRMKEEEEELLKSVHNQRSRSGRIRKPSRFSLDIARLTKKKSVAASGDSSADESEQQSKLSTPASAKSSAKRGSVAANEPTPQSETPTIKRGRGRPRRPKVEVETDDSAAKNENEEKTQPEKKSEKDDEKEKTSPQKKTEEEPATRKSARKKAGKGSNDENESADTTEEAKKVEGEKVETTVEKEKSDSELADKEENKETETEKDTKAEAGTESEKEVTSTENDSGVKKDAEKDESETEKMDTSEATEKKSNDATPEPDTSADAAKPESEKPSEQNEMDTAASFSLKVDEGEELGNKFSLRKLLEQCSADEIKSVFLPEAFDSINFGDFLLYKSGQSHKTEGKVSFPHIYEQFESLHKSAVKEATRYNTLVKRANKVGGDKRMEKIVLMPVYHRSAADSLEISSTSIDAHICGIQKPVTTQMIAANSFFIKARMESPTVRLRLPEATAPKHSKVRGRRPAYANYHQPKHSPSRRQPEPDSTTSDQPKPQKRESYAAKYSALVSGRPSATGATVQVRKPTYLEQIRNGGQVHVGGQNHYVSASSQETLLQNVPVDSSKVTKSSGHNVQMTSALAQLQATVDQHQQSLVTTTNSTTDSLTTSATPSVDQLVAQTAAGETTFITTSAANADSTAQAEQYFISDEGVAVANDTTDGGVQKHLVPIGDGQYVELPEGYSLIQTDEGYIIGQPGSTFTQGEDGNVYVTNSDGTTSKITQEAAGDEAVTVMDAAAEG